MYVLYHSPGACSQVSLFALEEGGIDYDIRIVDLARGEQGTPKFLELSPLGKVPCLVIDGKPLTENSAILFYISAICPQAGLLPADNDPRSRAEVIRGLSFCASNLHPQVRGIVNPARLSIGDLDSVRQKALALAAISFAEAEEQLAGSGWWFSNWSVIDVYIDWAFRTACSGGFDGRDFETLRSLPDRLSERPAYVRMRERDRT